MSIHPSLSSASKTKKHRSVLKRFEKLRILIEKGKWQVGDSIFGLPKVKTVKIKLKKEKAKDAEKAAVATAPAEGGAKAAEVTPKEKKKAEEKPKKN